jgi:hypothetical protein
VSNGSAVDTGTWSCARAIEVGNEFLRRQVAAQDHLVADDGAIDVVVLARECDQRGEFAFVAFGASLDPRAGHDLHAVELRDARDLRVFRRGIRAQALGVARQHAHVAVDVRLGREDLPRRILVALERIEREAGDLAMPVRDVHGPVEERPQPDVARGHEHGHGERAPEGFAHDGRGDDGQGGTRRPEIREKTPVSIAERRASAQLRGGGTARFPASVDDGRRRLREIGRQNVVDAGESAGYCLQCPSGSHPLSNWGST